MKCLIRNEGSEFKIMDAIMCYVVKGIARPEGMIDVCGTLIGCLLAREKCRNSERNLLQCHFIHHECYTDCTDWNYKFVPKDIWNYSFRCQYSWMTFVMKYILYLLPSSVPRILYSFFPWTHNSNDIDFLLSFISYVLWRRHLNCIAPNGRITQNYKLIRVLQEVMIACFQCKAIPVTGHGGP
jgi:hypothetical protein